MNKCIIINGSPRYKKSNSGLLMQQFIQGYKKHKDYEPEMLYLTSEKMRLKALDAFSAADEIILIFPLYTDAMPGIVKEFFELLITQKEQQPKKKIGIIVQSGFPETSQSDPVKRYLEKLFTQRIKCNFIGTIIKGGVEGIQIMPPRMTKKVFDGFKELGSYYALKGEFNPDIVAQFRNPYQLSKGRKRLFAFLNKLGITNFYWNNNLKKNNAFHQRFDAPYGPSAQ